MRALTQRSLSFLFEYLLLNAVRQLRRRESRFHEAHLIQALRQEVLAERDQILARKIATPVEVTARFIGSLQIRLVISYGARESARDGP